MKTVEFQGIKIRLDRPKGFVQRGKDSSGKPWERTYLYDYGFIPKTDGGDSEEMDVFLGPDKDADEAFWVSQSKDDGSFDEYKIFLGFPTKASAKKAYGQHIPMKYFGTMVTMKVPMMKAMLGIDPMEKMATWVGFFGELEEIQQ